MRERDETEVMQEGDEVEIPFDEDDFDEAEERFELEAIEGDDGRFEDEDDILTT